MFIIISSFFYPQIKLCKMYLAILYSIFISLARKSFLIIIVSLSEAEQNTDFFYHLFVKTYT